MQFPHIPVNQTNLSDQEYKRRYHEFLMRLRQARLNAGLTQAEVAMRLGKSQSFVSRSESGSRRVDVVELQAFAAVYGEQFSYFEF